VLGASSTRAVVKAAIEGREMQLEDVVRIADEASEVLQFNRALLQAPSRTSPRASAWSTSPATGGLEPPLPGAVQLPGRLISVGRPIADIIRYNAERGLCGPGEGRVHVARRLHWMRQGRAHTPSACSPMAG
jgi:hypothetical protein